MRRSIYLVVAALAVAAVFAARLASAPGRTPDGQPQLRALDGSALPDFESDFNRAADDTRVVALLSPT